MADRKSMEDVNFYMTLANGVLRGLGITKSLSVNIAYDGSANKRLTWSIDGTTATDDRVSCRRVTTREEYDVVFTAYQVLDQVAARMGDHARELLQGIPEHRHMRRAAGSREREIMEHLRMVSAGCADGVYRLTDWSGNSCEWCPARLQFVG